LIAYLFGAVGKADNQNVRCVLKTFSWL
jgi:hypothetical protein